MEPIHKKIEANEHRAIPFFKGIAVEAIMYIGITTSEYSRLHSIPKIAIIKNRTARGGHQGRLEPLLVAL
jgi:hypothetical protein